MIVAVVFCAALSASGPARPDALTEVQNCRAIGDPAARLACYDAAAEHAAAPAARAAPGAHGASTMATTATLSAAPSAVAPPMPPKPALNAEQQFGLPEQAVAAREVAAGTRAANAVKIEAHITRLSPAPDGRILFALDNRQVWRQLSAEGDLLAKPGDAVTVSRGALGSFWLEASTGRGCKVTRIQ